MMKATLLRRLRLIGELSAILLVGVLGFWVLAAIRPSKSWKELMQEPFGATTLIVFLSLMVAAILVKWVRQHRRDGWKVALFDNGLALILLAAYEWYWWGR
jgi:hypothetical protein